MRRRARDGDVSVLLFEPGDDLVAAVGGNANPDDPQRMLDLAL